MEIVSHRRVGTVTVRPLRLSIRPQVDGGRIRFSLPGPGHAVVEIDTSCLHLFASPPEDDVPSGSSVVRFGPGIHRPGIISLESGQTLHVAAGAVVYGAVRSRGAEKIRIAGRGIIDASGFQRGEAGGCIRLSGCRNVTIEGVILRDPDIWCLSAFGCRNILISDVKLIGLWRYNSDGIDLCNCENAVVRDSFIRSFDDSIVVKGIREGADPYDHLPARSIIAERCVVWNDWGRPLEIGAETCAPEVCDITFRDCDILRTSYVALDIQHGDRASVHDILFEEIRVEMDAEQYLPRIQTNRDERYSPGPADRFLPRLCVIDIRPTMWSKDPVVGTVRRVAYRNISVTAPSMPESVFRGYDDDHDVRDVAIAGLRLNGRPVTTLDAARVTVGPHASGVHITAE